MKERLDVLLVKKGLAESREKAKAIIMSGKMCIRDSRRTVPEHELWLQHPQDLCQGTGEGQICHREHDRLKRCGGQYPHRRRGHEVRGIEDNRIQ